MVEAPVIYLGLDYDGVLVKKYRKRNPLGLLHNIFKSGKNIPLVRVPVLDFAVEGVDFLRL